LNIVEAGQTCLVDNEATVSELKCILLISVRIDRAKAEALPPTP
jgi:hypothetical protein